MLQHIAALAKDNQDWMALLCGDERCKKRNTIRTHSSRLLLDGSAELNTQTTCGDTPWGFITYDKF